jgi:hypothetical protein
MPPRKAAKETRESSGQSSEVIFDTSPRSINTVKTWTNVFNILQYELVNFPDDSSNNENEDLSTKYKTIAQAEMHKVATRPILLPYNDMIKWALDHVDIPTRTIFNSQKVVVGSFLSEHLHVMYKLSSTPKFVYNASFLENFGKKECDQYGKNISDLIKDWCSRTEKFEADSHGIYSISSLEPQFMYIAMMMCRLYGKENTTHLFVPWVPIIHTVAEGYSFDWAKISSDSLTSEITEYQTKKTKGQSHSFYMSSYIMDTICFMTPFSSMDWSWTPDSAEPIHIYHSKLWEDKANDFFYEICNWVAVSMHIAIFGHSPPRISNTVVANLDKVEN